MHLAGIPTMRRPTERIHVSWVDPAPISSPGREAVEALVELGFGTAGWVFGHGEGCSTTCGHSEYPAALELGNCGGKLLLVCVGEEGSAAVGIPVWAHDGVGRGLGGNLRGVNIPSCSQTQCSCRMRHLPLPLSTR